MTKRFLPRRNAIIVAAILVVVGGVLLSFPWRFRAKPKIRLVNPEKPAVPPPPQGGANSPSMSRQPGPDYSDVDAKIADLGYDGSDDPAYARRWLAAQYISGVSGSALVPDRMKKLGWTDEQIATVQKLMTTTLKEVQEQETAHRVLIEESQEGVVFDVMPYAEETGINLRFWNAVKDAVGPREMKLFASYGMDFINMLRGFGTQHWRYRVKTLGDSLMIEYWTVDERGKEHSVGSSSYKFSSHRFSHLVQFEDVASGKAGIPQAPTPLK